MRESESERGRGVLTMDGLAGYTGALVATHACAFYAGVLLEADL